MGDVRNEPRYLSESRTNEHGQLFNCRATETDKGWLFTFKRNGKPVQGIFSPIILTKTELSVVARVARGVSLDG